MGKRMLPIGDIYFYRDMLYLRIFLVNRQEEHDTKKYYNKDF